LEKYNEYSDNRIYPIYIPNPNPNPIVKSPLLIFTNLPSRIEIPVNPVIQSKFPENIFKIK
jgi:hypothetical protein